MIIGIELDSIVSSPISNYTSMEEVSNCSVINNSKEAIDKLKELGHTIVLYSSRDASLGPETEIWLQRNKIHYDRIMFNKPKFDLLIEKDSCKFDNWDSILEKYKYHLRNN